MPVFEYKALNIKGKNISGIIDAESSGSARQQLRLSKIFPVSIQEVDGVSTKKEPRSVANLFQFKRVKPSEISMMTRQLATLLGAGFPLVSAIDTLAPQIKAHTFKRIMTQIKNLIVEGNSFAYALSLFSNIFSQLYINMVRAGETSGTLEIVLEKLADITEKQEALKNKIKSALTYPALMTLVGAAVLFFLVTFIVPSITSIFTDMNQVLPVPTRILIYSSGLFKSYWWIILVVLAGILIAFHRIGKTKKGRHLIDKTILFLPGVGSLSKKLAAARFAGTLGSLLENGVTMLSALEIVKNIAGNILIADAVEKAAEEVGKGQGLGVSLATSNLFPHLAIQMIQVGEQSGELESMLTKIATVFENEVESSVMNLTSLLEPLLILGMGIAVGFIVLSICLPIFEMNQLIM